MTVKLGDLIDQLHAKSLEIEAAGALKKKLEKERERIQAAYILAADEQGITQARGSTAAATISESVVPHVEDWDKFYAYLHENKYFHLLQKRPAVPGCRELFELGTQIPGVVPFTKKVVNLRAI